MVMESPGKPLSLFCLRTLSSAWVQFGNIYDSKPWEGNSCVPDISLSGWRHHCCQLTWNLCVLSVANSVYMYNVPPPYPGIDPNLPAAYPSAPQVNGHYAAANAGDTAASAPYPDAPQSAAAGKTFFSHGSLYGSKVKYASICIARNVR